MLGRPAEDRVEPLRLGVRWETGAPTPVLLQGDWRSFLAFYLTDPPGPPAIPAPEWIGVIEWLNPTATLFGYPNEDIIGLDGHRLSPFGLSELDEPDYQTGARW